jgi:hypothetical protein
MTVLKLATIYSFFQDKSLQNLIKKGEESYRSGRLRKIEQTGDGKFTALVDPSFKKNTSYAVEVR